MVKRKRKAAIKYDLDARTVEFTTIDGKRMEVGINGIDAGAVTKLALMGAAQVLSRRRDARAGWEQIKRGDFGKGHKDTFPLVVEALREVRLSRLAPGEFLTTKQVHQDWIALDDEARKALRADPQVKRAIALKRVEKLEAAEPESDNMALDLYYPATEEEETLEVANG